ncbi:CBU_0592 family membrane protein [Parvularcula oceani]|uniref:CBU_0592 family membrane protein n=1 Tax=Parvularcula oceani TaxID=1247963 RepID=UPI00192E467E|nr:hypothetical protein [Parvularcula oceani]
MQDWSLTLPDAVGFLGVGLLIGTYAALQFGRLAAENPWYSALNALAAVLITVSLFYSFNAASFVIEVFWFAISAYGLWRALRRRRAEG